MHPWEEHDPSHGGYSCRKERQCIQNPQSYLKKVRLSPVHNVHIRNWPWVDHNRFALEDIPPPLLVFPEAPWLQWLQRGKIGLHNRVQIIRRAYILSIYREQDKQIGRAHV